MSAPQEPSTPGAQVEPPLLPRDETARLEALRSYEVLDTPPEPSFDDITQLAAQLCGTPISLISLIDEERVWLKSRTGTDNLEFPRDSVFCGRAALHPELHVVPDTLADPLTAGKGTTFRVLLPPRAMEDGERGAEQVAEPPRRSRILAVDDEPMVLNALRRTLSSAHELTLFTRAQAALAWLEQGEPWDLILCDLMMPEMTGMEFHAELSRRMPERAGHVIFVTGGAFTAGARDFLGQITTPIVEKPFDPKALRQLIHEQFQRR